MACAAIPYRKYHKKRASGSPLRGGPPRESPSDERAMWGWTVVAWYSRRIWARQHPLHYLVWCLGALQAPGICPYFGLG